MCWSQMRTLSLWATCSLRAPVWSRQLSWALFLHPSLNLVLLAQLMALAGQRAYASMSLDAGFETEARRPPFFVASKP